VLVITGAGDQAFCAGADLKEMAATGLKVPPPEYLPQVGAVAKPVIAAVNGVAYAGGFLLAQSCDLCIASGSARFAISEVKVGRGAPWAAPLPWCWRRCWVSRQSTPSTSSASPWLQRLSHC